VVNSSAFLLQGLKAFGLSMDAGNNIAGSDDTSSNTQEKQTDVSRTSAQSPPFFLSSATGGSKGGIPEAKKETNLDERLAKLTETERALEERLASLAKVEQALERRLASAKASTPAISSGVMSNTHEGNKGTASQSIKSVDNIWETLTPTTVQGGSLRTWSYANPAVERVFVSMKTDGRPLDADVELWQGPDNTPQKMKVYVEDGAKRTFSTFIDTPRSPNTICIKNTGQLEFPLYACVGPDKEAGDACLAAARVVKGDVIQGGALRTYPFEPDVNSVAVLIKTDGRPLNARIELLQGPNNNKQVLELYTEDGLDRPFLAVVQTPGTGNVVRVVNTAPVEFPMYAYVTAYEYASEDAYANDGVQIGREW